MLFRLVPINQLQTVDEFQAGALTSSSASSSKFAKLAVCWINIAGCIHTAELTLCGAGHHAGDVGPPPAWGGIGDDIYGPCASAGMFGCAPVNSTNDYFRDGDPHVRTPCACTASCSGDPRKEIRRAPLTYGCSVPAGRSARGFCCATGAVHVKGDPDKAGDPAEM